MDAAAGAAVGAASVRGAAKNRATAGRPRRAARRPRRAPELDPEPQGAEGRT